MSFSSRRPDRNTHAIHPLPQVGDLMQNLNRFEARVAHKKKLPAQVEVCRYRLLLERSC